jgi:hypothetical protein
MGGQGRAGNGMNRSINRWMFINLGSRFRQEELPSFRRGKQRSGALDGRVEIGMRVGI